MRSCGARSSAPCATAFYGATLLALWFLGLGVGSVHPLGLLAALAAGGMFTWFVAALGTFSSLKSKTTWRAQALTQGVVILPHLCCVYFAPSLLFVMGISLLSYQDVDELLKIKFTWIEWDHWYVLLAVAYCVLYVVGGLTFYLGGAYFMTRAAFRGFDATADRPRRLPRRRNRPDDPKKEFEAGGPEDVLEVHPLADD